MNTLINSEQFKQDYQKLKHVSLNHERHTAENAFEHCEQVADKALELAKLNQRTDDEESILYSLAKVHDIGKINGNSKPEESLELLKSYGEVGPEFYNLVKYHDINLPWYISFQKGQSPSNKAWRKLTSKVDLGLLCIFMIADRVDCPGSWTENKALVWFLEQAEQRGYISSLPVTN